MSKDPESHPRGWVEQFERHLDEGQRRAVFYGGMFGAFVLLMVIAGLIFAVADAPPF